MSSVKFAAVFLSRNRSRTERNFTPETERRTRTAGAVSQRAVNSRRYRKLILAWLGGHGRGRKTTLLPLHLYEQGTSSNNTIGEIPN